MLKENISAFYNYVDKVVIWDNSNCSEIESFVSQNFQGSNIECIYNNKNYGISQALNFAWKYAKEGGFDALMSMDQDSVWINFKDYKSIVENVYGNQKCIFGPEVNKETTDWHDIQVTNFVITSGMIIPVEIIESVGGYPTEFFVDGIDIHMCTWAKIKGYNVYVVKGCILKQQFGENIHFRLLNKYYLASNYSPSRLYGIFRNHIIIYRTTHSKPVLFLIKGFFIVSPKIIPINPKIIFDISEK